MATLRQAIIEYAPPPTLSGADMEYVMEGWVDLQISDALDVLKVVAKDGLQGILAAIAAFDADPDREEAGGGGDEEDPVKRRLDLQGDATTTVVCFVLTELNRRTKLTPCVGV